MGIAHKLSIRVIGALFMLNGLALTAHTAVAADGALVSKGKQVAFDRKKGNCLACHAIGDGESPGDLGPALAGMRARFPQAAALKAQIVDPTRNNPDTRMPPFGRHGILSEAEIDAIVAYLYTL